MTDEDWILNAQDDFGRIANGLPEDARRALTANDWSGLVSAQRLDPDVVECLDLGSCVDKVLRDGFTFLKLRPLGAGARQRLLDRRKIKAGS